MHPAYISSHIAIIWPDAKQLREDTLLNHSRTTLGKNDSIARFYSPKYAIYGVHCIESILNAILLDAHSHTHALTYIRSFKLMPITRTNNTHVRTHSHIHVCAIKSKLSAFFVFCLCTWFRMGENEGGTVYVDSSRLPFSPYNSLLRVWLEPIIL